MTTPASALARAVSQLDRTNVAAALAAGAQPQVGTLLWLAAQTGSARPAAAEIALELLRRGASVHEVDFHGRTPVQLAAYQNNDAVLRYLMLYGGSTRDPDKTRGWLPLHYAIAGSADDTVTLLLCIDALAASCQTHNGMTALHCATLYGTTSIVQLILHACPAAASVRSSCGHTAKELAAMYGREDVYALLPDETCQVCGVGDANDCDICYCTNSLPSAESAVDGASPWAESPH